MIHASSHRITLLFVNRFVAELVVVESSNGTLCPLNSKPASCERVKAKMRLFQAVTLICIFLCVNIMTVFPEVAEAETINVWIGTSKSSLSRGIYHCQLNTNNRKLSEPTLVAEMEGPGFLAKHPTKPVLYAVGGLNNVPVVAAFAIEGSPEKPSLRLLNSVPIGDGGAAHVSLDKTGKTLFTAQFGGGSVAVFSVQPDGMLRERTQLIDHRGGANVVADRQDTSHAHWTGYT